LPPNHLSFPVGRGSLGVGALGMDSQARAGFWLARDRACARRKAQGEKGFSRGARGVLVIASKARFGPIPLRLAYGALRGIGPALAEEARGRIGPSRCARGALVIASKARCGPIPLRLAYFALRGNGPALAEEALGRFGLSRCARVVLVFASKVRCGPIPLSPGVDGVDESMRDRGCLVKRAFRLSPRSSFARAGPWGCLHRAVSQN
jgi:hypothetical protein